MGKDGKVHLATGELHLTSKGDFQFFFDKRTDEVYLNDGKAHSLVELSGVATELWITHEGVHIRGFVKVSGNWHIDGFCFYYNKPMVD